MHPMHALETSLHPSRTFEELATHAHDIELSIASHGHMKPPILKEMKERKEVRKNDTNAKGNIKDSMVVNTVVVKVP